MQVDVAKLLERLQIDASLRGSEFWARCPFHEERSASFHIRHEPGSERNGRWHCFGCIAGGGPVGLVAGMLSIDTREARAWLLKSGSADDSLRTYDANAIEEVGGLIRPRFVLHPSVEFAPLEEWPSVPRKYLADRGVTAEQVERWGIGFALSGRLRHRVVVVKRDRDGRPGAYSARSYIGATKRYLEPVTKDDPKAKLRNEFPDLGLVFGEQHWPEQAARDVVIVAEGAFDLLAAERATACPIAGISGSNPSPTHLLKIATFRRVVLALDPDNAGDKATEIMRDAFGRVDVRIVRVPDGHDLNSLEQSDGGRERLRALLAAAWSGD